MNIQRIYILPNYNAVTGIRTNNTVNQMYRSKLEPLHTDSVSFQAKGTNIVSKELKAALARKEARALRDARQIAEAKKVPDKTAPTKKNLSGEERIWGVSISTAKQIRELILEPQKQIHNFMISLFGDMKATSLEPKNTVFDFSDRAKSILSIAEKSSTRRWNSIKEVLANMTDLNGGKVVMNYKTGKKEVEDVLSQLIPLIKTKYISLQEIELQRPSGIKKLSKKEQEEYDYVSKVFLDKLEEAQEEVLNGSETNIDKIKLIDRPLPKYTKGNYCALHLLLQLNEKGSRPFELQIMGAREAKSKDFHDKGFKYFNDKELDKKYAPLIQLWEPLKADENKAAKEEFLQYWHDANLQIREDELHENRTQRILTRSTGFFRTIRGYNLTPEYDLNEQYKLMVEIDTRTKTAKANDKKVTKSIEEKVVDVEERVMVLAKETASRAKEKVDLTKEKLQKLVAKYTPKSLQKNGKKNKI